MSIRFDLLSLSMTCTITFLTESMVRCSHPDTEWRSSRFRPVSLWPEHCGCWPLEPEGSRFPWQQPETTGEEESGKLVYTPERTVMNCTVTICYIKKINTSVRKLCNKRKDTSLYSLNESQTPPASCRFMLLRFTWQSRFLDGSSFTPVRKTHGIFCCTEPSLRMFGFLSIPGLVLTKKKIQPVSTGGVLDAAMLLR